MFERASIINPKLANTEFDVGRILEAMLYYSHIDFIVDARSFNGLLNTIGFQRMDTLLSHPSLNVKITPEMPAVMNNTNGGITAHRPVYLISSGREEKLISAKDTVGSLLFMAQKRHQISKKEVKSIVKKFGDVRFGKILGENPEKSDVFHSMISDSATMRAFLSAYAIRHGLAFDTQKMAKLQVEIQKVPDGYVIFNSVSLKEIVPGLEKDGWDNILPFINDYRMDLYFSQVRSADILTDEVGAMIASDRLDLSINRALRTDAEKTAFEQFAFGQARPFGEAFNNGTITLAEALKVIDETAKFRSWLTGLPPDASIIEEFHKAVNRETILDRLPGRSARFSFFTGAGIAADLMATGGLGTAVGLGLSAFDTFVVDGLAKGWRPNSFVGKIKDEVLKD